MPYQKRAKASYGRKPTFKLLTKAHVVVALSGGVLEEVHVILDRKKAKAKRDKLAKKYDLVGKQYTESPHGKECRWCDLDEDEVHLHKVDVE